MAFSSKISNSKARWKMSCNYCIILYLHEKEWWRIYCIINSYWRIIYVNLWQTSSKQELLNLFHIVEYIENGIYVAPRGKSNRTHTQIWSAWVSVDPKPCPASPRAKMISISAHLRDTFRSHQLWSASFQYIWSV